MNSLLSDNTPIKRYLEKINYYKQYRKVYFPPVDDSLSIIYGKFKGGFLIIPKGLSGEELIKIRNNLKNEYKIYEHKNDSLEECRKRGALEGHE